MAKGDIYLHENFPFSDGSFGKKYFIILFEPTDTTSEPYLVIKTTSQLKGKRYIIGCNPNQKVFFVPQKNIPIFSADTLLQLQEIFEFTAIEFLKGSLEEKVVHHKGEIPDITLRELINCIRKLKEDIQENHFEMITRA